MPRTRTWPSAAALALAGALLLTGCTPLQQIGQALSDPSDADLLAAVSLTQDDAAEGAELQPYEGGTEVFGRVSLDLCYADFPSESLRTGRNQVGIADATGAAWVSSEAILYSTPEDAEQAMGELRAADEDCPQEPVDPPQLDREPLTWQFDDAPDSDWPAQPGVARQSYAFTVTSPAEETSRSTATYLQRGRMILALYSTPPDSPAAALRNAPDQARFVEVMAARLAALPEDALQYGPPLEDPDALDA